MATFLLRRQTNKKEDRKSGLSDGRCKRHPKHRQSPGVCSLCLRERLVSHINKQTATSSSRRPTGASSSSASSLSSYYSSSSASSCSSPARRSNGNASVLKKSRSVALVSDEKRKSGIGFGFWSKLLHVNSNENKREKRSLAMHSKTVRERTSSIIMSQRLVR